MNNKKTKSKGGDEKQVKLLEAQLVRALADYDNLSKRIEREKEETEVVASLKIIINLLPVLDMTNQVQQHLKDPGLAMTIKELEDVLGDEGVERINTKAGDKFDEELHEAVGTQDVKMKGAKIKGEVSEVLLDGWRVKDGPVIRYTKVKVK